MVTRQSKDKYTYLRSMKNELQSTLAPDAKRQKFGEGKFEGPTTLALFQASVSPTPLSVVVVALPSSIVAHPVTHFKGKGKVGRVYEPITSSLMRSYGAFLLYLLISLLVAIFISRCRNVIYCFFGASLDFIS